MTEQEKMSNFTRSVTIPARTIYPPQSISVEAQASLSRLVDEDGSPINARYEMPSPEDFSGWMMMKAAVDAHYAAAAKDLAGSLKSTVETIVVEQATIHVARPHGSFHERSALIDLHGGAEGGEACRVSARHQAHQHAVRCYGVDYRMPPEHPYPAALDDCLATYRHVLNGHPPTRWSSWGDRQAAISRLLCCCEREMKACQCPAD